MRGFIIPGIVTIFLAAVIFLLTKDDTKNEAVIKGDLPDIQLLLTDSIATYNVGETKGKNPVLLLFFNTTCDHCQSFATQMLEKQGQLKDITLIMASSEELSLIKKFHNQYSLFELQNLVIGQDVAAAGTRTFQFESYPFCALYNKQHQFIRSFEREFTLDEVLNALNNR